MCCRTAGEGRIVRVARPRPIQLQQIGQNQKLLAQLHLLLHLLIVHVIDGHLAHDRDAGRVRILGDGLEELLKHLAVWRQLQRGHGVRLLVGTVHYLLGGVVVNLNG